MRPHLISGLAAAIIAIACTATPMPSSTDTPAPVDWGPLAVYRSGGGMDALMTGTLRLTYTCVYIEGGRRYLVVWPHRPELWHWNDATREIVSTWGSRTIHFASGDAIAVGGGGWSVTESSHIQDRIDGTEWVQPPHPDCDLSTVWFASGQISEP